MRTTNPDGFYFPAEWEPHRATWLSWPHNPDTWVGEIDSIFNGYLHFIKEISRNEQVCLNVSDLKMEQEARGMLSQRDVPLHNVEFYHHPTNDAWCRDHGPCFLLHTDGRKMIINWKYHAWGEKYPPYILDNSIPERISQALGLEFMNPNLVLEGGSVEFNGAGTLLTTKSCLLNPNRNPSMSQQELEEMLLRFFGVKQVLWLEQGIAGDDTDGHIDTICRFVNASSLVTVLEEDPLELNFEPLQDNYRALAKMKLWNGRHPEIITLPMPSPKFHKSQRLPASYANFYICNGAVLVPTYRDPKDQEALAILRDLFKTRSVIGIDCLEIIKGLGGLHCLCMQEPL